MFQASDLVKIDHAFADEISAASDNPLDDIENT